MRKLPEFAASQVIILICNETPKGISHFKVRSDNFRDAISLLINRYYHHIDLYEAAVDCFPEDGDAIAIL